MLKKKLLALACAVGILASGACFVPIHYKPTPPPPIASEGIKNIRVIVVDKSESHRIDTLALSEQIVSVIDRGIFYTGVKAHESENYGAQEDALLEVTILSTNATPQQSSSQNEQQTWNFEITTSATLTRKNGEKVWSNAKEVSTFHPQALCSKKEDVWANPFVQSELLRKFARVLAYDALYQRPRDLAAPNPLP